RWRTTIRRRLSSSSTMRSWCMPSGMGDPLDRDVGARVVGHPQRDDPDAGLLGERARGLDQGLAELEAADHDTGRSAGSDERDRLLDEEQLLVEGATGDRVGMPG